MTTKVIDPYSVGCDLVLPESDQDNITLVATTSWGLNFTLYLGSVGPNIGQQWNGVSTLGDCLYICLANSCDAVNFNTLCQCWTGIQNGVPSEGDDVITAYASQLSFLTSDPLCPYPNLSIQKASNGAEFKIISGSDCAGGDYVPTYASSLPQYHGRQRPVDPYSYPEDPQHVDSFEECMEFCATSHPLCRGFAYLPQGQWLNCFPKNATNLQPNGLTPLWRDCGLLVEPSKDAVQHVKCNNGKRVKVSNAEGSELSFILSCEDFRLPLSGTTGIITQTHTETLTDCINACASMGAGPSGEPCIATVFDDGLEYGWDNCYLKSEIGPGHSRKNYTLAYLDSVEGQYTLPAGQTKGGFGGGKIAAIVLSIIGAVVLVALIYRFWPKRYLLSRSRRYTKASQDEASIDTASDSSTRGLILDTLGPHPRRTYVRHLSSSSISGSSYP